MSAFAPRDASRSAMMLATVERAMLEVLDREIGAELAVQPLSTLRLNSAVTPLESLYAA